MDYNAARQRELAKAFGPDRYRALTGDISDEAFVRAAVAEAASIGHLDLLINNAMSTAATRGNANESVYCATKWGERGYTESLKAAYKGTSVKIVGVCPGVTDILIDRNYV